MEREGRFSAGIATDFDVAEGETPPAGSERLHGGLLRSETTGHVFGARSGMTASRRDLSRPEDPFEEAVSPALEESGDAVDFDEIETEKELQRFGEKAA